MLNLSRHGLTFQKEDVEPLAGYLSLHQGFDGLCLKWTPNQLMNGCCEEEDDQAIDRRYGFIFDVFKFYLLNFTLLSSFFF